MGQVPELNSKWDKLGTKGLVVIGVTDEPLALVDAWVRQNKPEYPIAVIPDEGFDRALGVKFFPSGAVIEPGGKIAYAGNVREMEPVLEQALAKASSGPAWPKALAKATKLLGQDDFGKCYAEVLKLRDGGKLEGPDLAFVEHFRSYLEQLAVNAVTEAKAFEEQGLIFKAVNAVEPFAEADPPFPATPECHGLAERLAALPDYKDEIKGGKGYLEAEELRREGEYTAAVGAFMKVHKKYDDTRIGKAALAAARELVSKGMPGFQSHCTPCRKGKRACDKHYEEIDL